MTGSENNVLQHSLSQLVGRKVAITAHVRPDGDAIGSTIGLYHILQAQGIYASILDLDPIPQRYQFLQENVPILSSEQIPSDGFDTVIVLDTGSMDRAPDFVTKWQQQCSIINIDHHPTNTRFGNENHVVHEAAAVAEIITRAATSAQWKISQRAATALWVGIVTDCGRFAYSCTTPDTLKAAAALVAVGIDTPDIDQRVFQMLSLGALQLQSRAIQLMQLLENERLAIIGLTQRDFKACHAKGEDAEEIINLPRKLDSVSVSILVTEMADCKPDEPRCKASLRTKPPFDAGAFCQAHGGGGHARAAGYEIALPFEQAMLAVTQDIRKAWFQA